MTEFTATYSPDDDKLRLYALRRLDAETYARAKAVGFRWAPKQDLFFAYWSPGAEDLLIELAGEIEDDDRTLVDRSEERADRFDGYRGKRLRDAESASKRVKAIADGIPLGQPILVGHHSERRARKDAQRIDDGMRQAVRMWETADYWKSRAKGALFHAKYKELPSVRARRIKSIEADMRRMKRNVAEANLFLKMWGAVGDPSKWKVRDGTENTVREQALMITNREHISSTFSLADFPRDLPASQYEGSMSLWSALEDNIITAEQARAIAVPVHERTKARCERWIIHYDNRLTYERAMLGETGGTVADKTRPEKGGAVRCWASPGFGHGWAYVVRVNKISVSVLDNHGNGGPNFNRVIEFDKLQGVMSKAEVEAARADGRLQETTTRGAGQALGFFLLEAPPPKDPDVESLKRSLALTQDEAEKIVEQVDADSRAPDYRAHDGTHVMKDDAAFEAMKDQLRKGGTKVVAVNQLFPTPPEVADRVIALAEIRADHRVLEPSAGTGALLAAHARAFDLDDPLNVARDEFDIVAVEISPDLVKALPVSFPYVDVHPHDFLACVPGCFGPQCLFDRIVMNPPFAQGQDVRHVMHALSFLKRGGVLVAIMSASVKFRSDRKTRDFRKWLDTMGLVQWWDLPPNTFVDAGTGVSTVLLRVKK